VQGARKSAKHIYSSNYPFELSIEACKPSQGRKVNEWRAILIGLWQHLHATSWQQPLWLRCAEVDTGVVAVHINYISTRRSGAALGAVCDSRSNRCECCWCLPCVWITFMVRAAFRCVQA
jgi:hypothetical protein